MSLHHHLVAAVLACAASSQAAEPPAPGEAAVLYGRLLTPEQRPVVAHTVKLQCPPATAEGTGVTDERGAFTLVVLGTTRGSCRLWVEMSGRRSAPVEVFVAGSSLRYDLLLDAQFELRKR